MKAGETAERAVREVGPVGAKTLSPDSSRKMAIGWGTKRSMAWLTEVLLGGTPYRGGKG